MTLNRKTDFNVVVGGFLTSWLQAQTARICEDGINEKLWKAPY